MEETKMSEVVEELRNATDEEIKGVIEGWFERTRTDGMKIGAQFIAAAVMGAIDKNLKNGMSSSHRDFERAIKRVIEIVSVQLKQQETVQNDLETEEVTNDGTAE
jgi:hypothetical protein